MSRNTTLGFGHVNDPLTQIQSTVEGITTSAVSSINQVTSVNNEACPFDDVYTKENTLESWTANEHSKKTNWVLLDSGTNGKNNRQGDETSNQYMKRTYSIAGICTPQDAFEDCCRQDT